MAGSGKRTHVVVESIQCRSGLPGIERMNDLHGRQKAVVPVLGLLNRELHLTVKMREAYDHEQPLPRAVGRMLDGLLRMDRSTLRESVSLRLIQPAGEFLIVFAPEGRVKPLGPE